MSEPTVYWVEDASMCDEPCFEVSSAVVYLKEHTEQVKDLQAKLDVANDAISILNRKIEHMRDQLKHIDAVTKQAIKKLKGKA